MKSDDSRRRVRDRRRRAASKYKPKLVKLLLVAEAPPPDEHRYFYFEKVEEHDWLFLYVAEAILGKRPNHGNKAVVLASLKKRGVFLIDVMQDPINGSDLTKHATRLVSRCRRLAPRRIILIKATVFDAVYESLRDAGLPVVNRRISFPSTGHQLEFLEQFAEALL